MNENSQKNLIPFVPGMDPKRAKGGAWPGWRQALRRVVGDGEKLFKKLDDLAMGIPQQPVYPESDPRAGMPIMVPVFVKGMRVGEAPLIVEVPPAVQKAAATELLDRAFGKPVQVVVDLSDDGEGKPEYVPAEDLTEVELQIVRKIAQRRMLGPRPKDEVKEKPDGTT